MSLIVPKVKKFKFSIGVAEPKIGSQISEVTTIPGQWNKFVKEYVSCRLCFILADKWTATRA